MKNNSMPATAANPRGTPTAAPTMAPVLLFFCAVDVGVTEFCDSGVVVVTAPDGEVVWE